VEALAGDTYFAAPEDVKKYHAAFDGMRDFALNADQSIGYLQSFATRIEQYLGALVD
jgi:hypothetical protein